MSDTDEDLYQCVGVCMLDPDSGYCMGCGRPPMGEPEIVAEPVVITLAPSNTEDESSPEDPV